MQKILELIDKYLRKFIGLDEEEISPELIKKIGNRVTIVNTVSHKRHTYSQNLDQFLIKDIKKLDNVTKEKLGISFGKTLATNLVVSFEEVKIEKEEHHD